MPRAIIAPGEYYHVYNRGVNKQNIFFDNRDYARMLFCILAFQSKNYALNTSFSVNRFLKNNEFELTTDRIAEIMKTKETELVAFALMPNHFHLLIAGNKDGSISDYLKRVEGGYTKYFNLKHKRSGYLLQGPFQSVHVKKNEQLLHLSAYIHRNPRELVRWHGNEHQYPWSSYPDYISKNRWPGILEPKIIMQQFRNAKNYKKFVDTSGTKLTSNDTVYLDD